MLVKIILKKLIDMSLFKKLAVIFSILFIISMSIMFYLQYSILMPIIKESEIKSEEKPYMDLTEFTDNTYNAVLKIVEQTYNNREIIKSLKKVNSQPQMYYDTGIINTFDDYMSGICFLESDIVDFILITDNNCVFHKSRVPNRRISLSYNFPEDKFVNSIRTLKTKLAIFSGNPGEYIVNGSEKTITFAGNIFNVDDISNLKSIGVFIINIPLSSFMNSNSSNGNSLDGDLLVANDHNEIIFSYNKDILGITYNKLENLRKANKKTEVFEGQSIINSKIFQDSGLMVISTLSKKIVWDKLRGLSQYMIIILGIILFITLVITMVISNHFNSRMRNLMKMMRKVQKGDLKVRIPVKAMDELGELSSIFNEMCSKLSEYINRVYFSEIELKSSELSALQAQINPHFLFNTLESIRMKAVVDGQYETSSMLSSLGNLFRWSVKNKKKIVRIEDEIDYISSYLELMQFRFGEKLEVELDISKEILSLGIPKLILQPIVENAVVHGISSIDGVGHVSITGRRNNDQIEIIVRDNGIGISDDNLVKLLEDINKDIESDDEYKIGIKNVHRRIRLLFSEPFGLKVKCSDAGGTHVEITIPIILEEDFNKYV